MKLLECLDRFNMSQDKSWWPIPDKSDNGVQLMTAAVSLSGRLEECETEADLREAVEHCMELVHSGVYTTMDWSKESQRVGAELEKWGKAVDDELGRAKWN